MIIELVLSLLLIASAHATDVCEDNFGDKNVVSIGAFRKKKEEVKRQKEESREENFARAWGLSREEQVMYNDLLRARDFLFGKNSGDSFVLRISDYFYGRSRNPKGKLPLEITVSNNIAEASRPAEIGIFFENTSGNTHIVEMLKTRFYKLALLLETKLAISNLDPSSNRNLEFIDSKTNFTFASEGTVSTMQVDVRVDKTTRESYVTTYIFTKDASGTIAIVTIRQDIITVIDGKDHMAQRDQLILFAE